MLKYFIKVKYLSSIRCLVASNTHILMFDKNYKIIIDIYPNKFSEITYKDFIKKYKTIKNTEKINYRKSRDLEKKVPNIGSHQFDYD